jgi:hypothetical protein
LTANMCVYISTACFSSSPSLIACPSQRHEAQYLQNTNPYLHFRSICHPCHPSPVRSCPSQQHPRSHQPLLRQACSHCSRLQCLQARLWANQLAPNNLLKISSPTPSPK